MAETVATDFGAAMTVSRRAFLTAAGSTLVACAIPFPRAGESFGNALDEMKNLVSLHDLVDAGPGLFGYFRTPALAVVGPLFQIPQEWVRVSRGVATIGPITLHNWADAACTLARFCLARDEVELCWGELGEHGGIGRLVKPGDTVIISGEIPL